MIIFSLTGTDSQIKLGQSLLKSNQKAKAKLAALKARENWCGKLRAMLEPTVAE